MYPDLDPVDVHEQVWKIRLVCPGGGKYVWNEKYQTMESTVYGHPGEPKTGPADSPLLNEFSSGSFGLTFEHQGLRACVSLEKLGHKAEAAATKPKSAACFGIPCDFSGKLSKEDEQKASLALRNAWRVESVQDITPNDLAAKLKNQKELARETSSGETFVAIRDVRWVHADNNVSGQMIVIERYRVIGDSPEKKLGAVPGFSAPEDSTQGKSTVGRQMYLSWGGGCTAAPIFLKWQGQRFLKIRGSVHRPSHWLPSRRPILMLWMLGRQLFCRPNRIHIISPGRLLGNHMPSLKPLIHVLIFSLLAAKPSSASETADILLDTHNLHVHIAAEGKITALKMGSDTIERPVKAETVLSGCRLEGRPKITRLAEGGVEFEKQFVHENGGERISAVERFLPKPDSIRWELDIRGQSEPWSTPIQTQIHWPHADQSRFWTSWGYPQSKAKAWIDPLASIPLENRRFLYGGKAPHKNANTISVPLLSVLDQKQDAGFSVALSPEDLLIGLELSTTAQGDVAFSRLYHRLDKTDVVRCRLDLVAHPADWRSGLGWMARRYPAYFDPPNPAVQQMAGCGAYSSHAKITDPERLMRMAFRINWKASFDFPYMGMFLPPVQSDAEEWVDFKNQKASLAKMRESARNLRRMGCFELNYFNVNECGTTTGIRLRRAKRRPTPTSGKIPTIFCSTPWAGLSSPSQWKTDRILARLRGDGSGRKSLSRLPYGTGPPAHRSHPREFRHLHRSHGLD